jgi:hypothetical protein
MNNITKCWCWYLMQDGQFVSQERSEWITFKNLWGKGCEGITALNRLKIRSHNKLQILLLLPKLKYVVSQGVTKFSCSTSFYLFFFTGILLLTVALFVSARMGIYQEVLYGRYGKHPRESLYYTVSMVRWWTANVSRSMSVSHINQHWCLCVLTL